MIHYLANLSPALLAIGLFATHLLVAILFYCWGYLHGQESERYYQTLLQPSPLPTATEWPTKRARPTDPPTT